MVGLGGRTGPPLSPTIGPTLGKKWMGACSPQMSLHCSETEYETLLGLIYDLENEQTRARRGDGRARLAGVRSRCSSK